MFEKFNSANINKQADRIAGAILDEAYRLQEYPNISVEVLLGHGICDIIAETSVELSKDFLTGVVYRITGDPKTRVFYSAVKVKPYTPEEIDSLKCPDNAYFSIAPTSSEEQFLGKLAREIGARYPHHGKYAIKNKNILIAQSNCDSEIFRKQLVSSSDSNFIINPSGDWNFDNSRATGNINSALHSDLGCFAGTCALHGRDTANPDITIPLYCYLRMKEKKTSVSVACLKGDTTIDGLPYGAIVKAIKKFVQSNVGGFEKLAEWGLA